MKRLYFSLLCLSLMLTRPAHTQTITNTNFAAAIRAACPTCISAGNVLLTPAQTLTSLNLYNKNISNLTGIGGFTALTTLNCRLNTLTSLPTLPTSLTTLDCSLNALTSLPTLPTSLTTLNCSGNPLPSLPTLPASLTTLNCSGNPLTSLPTLPVSLTTLNCNNNKLLGLPTLPTSLTTLECYNSLLPSLPTLPASLTSLKCSQNKLPSLPTLPASLTYLDCFGNLLTSLPTLPTSLTTLICSSNQLPSLPTLPASLTTLICVGCQLLSLPTLPTSLTTLNCSENTLTRLPTLPSSLKDLYCYFNQLTRLPTLPASLTSLYIDSSTPCIPNTVIGLGIYDESQEPLNLPICVPLGVELRRFEATKTEQSNLLIWETASEKNNKGFDIERSTDGTTFHSIGQVKGNNKPSSYQFVDNQPFATTYYRLRQIDFDGTETYSKIVSVERRDAINRVSIKVYPNPVSSLLNVVYTEGSSFQILNLLGQQVLTGKTPPSGVGGLDVSALPQGTYILKVGAEQAKFLKQ
jgi:Leucine-rich repeat (LRR) protein